MKNLSLKQLGPNQTQIETKQGVILFSYETPVAAILHDNGLNPIAYRTGQKWSRTTSKHINQWLDGRTTVTKEQSFFDSLAV